MALDGTRNLGNPVAAADGRRYTKYLDGNTGGTPPDVTASQAVPDDLTNLTSAAFELDLLQYFTGADVGTGTISFVETVGTLAGVGLALVGDDLEDLTPLAGVVSGYARWTDGSYTFVTNTFTLAFQEPLGSGDVYGPTKVINVSYTPGSGQVTVAHDRSSDPHDGTDPGSGLDRYEYLLDGVEVASETAAAGLSLPYTDGTIGTLSPSGSNTETGAAGTITSEGQIGENSGTYARIDHFRYAKSVPWSGDFVRSVEAVSFATSATYSKFGVMARFGTETDAAFVFGQIRPDGYAYLEYRATAGGNRVTLGGIAVPFPALLRLSLSGSTWTFSAVIEGAEVTQVAQITLAPPASFDLMLAACSTSDGVATTATYEHDSLWTGAQISKVLTTASSASLTIRAVDADENVGEVSDAVIVIPSTSSVGMKWNPGHWSFCDAVAGISSGTPLGYTTASLTAVAAIGLKGWYQFTSWAQLEGNTRGDYTAGFAYVDELLNQCSARGLRLCLQPWSHTFAGTSLTRFPSYLQTIQGGSTGLYLKPTGGVQAHVWDSRVMDAYIELVEAYGARYNSTNIFEMFGLLGETTIPNTGPGYTNAGYVAQLDRCMTAARAAWPNTLIDYHANFTQTREYEEQLIARAHALGLAVGGPDIYASNVVLLNGTNSGDKATWADKVMAGLTWNGSAWVSGGTDYRGVIARVSCSEDPVYGDNRYGTWIPQQVYDTAYSYQRNSHIFWSRKQYVMAGNKQQVHWQSPAPAERDSGYRIRDWLVANMATSPTRTTFPSRYTAMGYSAVTNG